MKRLIAALFLILLPATALAGDEYAARVVGISDGDTITVLTAQKKQVKIRLYGIDAPESGQDFATAARSLRRGRRVTG